MDLKRLHRVISLCATLRWGPREHVTNTTVKWVCQYHNFDLNTQKQQQVCVQGWQWWKEEGSSFPFYSNVLVIDLLEYITHTFTFLLLLILIHVYFPFPLLCPSLLTGFHLYVLVEFAHYASVFAGGHLYLQGVLTHTRLQCDRHLQLQCYDRSYIAMLQEWCL